MQLTLILGQRGPERHPYLPRAEPGRQRGESHPRDSQPGCHLCQGIQRNI